MEEHVVGFDLSVLAAPLRVGRRTSLRYSPMRRERLKLPTVATALTLFLKIYSARLLLLRACMRRLLQ